jgi:hypothetical protein
LKIRVEEGQWYYVYSGDVRRDIQFDSTLMGNSMLNSDDKNRITQEANSLHSQLEPRDIMYKSIHFSNSCESSDDTICSKLARRVPDQ